jgi:hypothetical protein
MYVCVHVLLRSIESVVESWALRPGSAVVLLSFDRFWRCWFVLTQGLLCVCVLDQEGSKVWTFPQALRKL